MSDTIIIRTLSDLRSVPKERHNALLHDLANWLAWTAIVAELRSEGAIVETEDEDSMRWTDDGESSVKLTLNITQKRTS